MQTFWFESEHLVTEPHRSGVATVRHGYYYKSYSIRTLPYHTTLNVVYTYLEYVHALYDHRVFEFQWLQDTLNKMKQDSNIILFSVIEHIHTYFKILTFFSKNIPYFKIQMYLFIATLTHIYSFYKYLYMC